MLDNCNLYSPLSVPSGEQEKQGCRTAVLYRLPVPWNSPCLFPSVPKTRFNAPGVNEITHRSVHWVFLLQLRGSFCLFKGGIICPLNFVEIYFNIKYVISEDKSMQYTKICSCFTQPVPAKCTNFGLGDKHSSIVDCCFDCFMLKVPAGRDVSGLLDRKKILQEYTLLGNLSAHHRFTLLS